MKLALTVIKQNTKAHLGRTILVFITIIISSAMIFVAGNVKDTAENVANTMQKKYIGNADLTVEMNADYQGVGYEKIETDKIKKLLEYNIGFYQISSYFIGENNEKVVMDFCDITIKELKKFSVYEVIEEKEDNNQLKKIF